MEECQRCREVDEDRRTLWMNCMYEMDELELPFTHLFLSDDLERNNRFHTLRVCKDCRSDWMKAIEYWFHNSSFKKESCGSGIFVREFGANVEISEEEWNRRNPDIVPIRIKDDKMTDFQEFSYDKLIEFVKMIVKETSESTDPTVSWINISAINILEEIEE